jgi:hypothetical protein
MVLFGKFAYTAEGIFGKMVWFGKFTYTTDGIKYLERSYGLESSPIQLTEYLKRRCGLESLPGLSLRPKLRRRRAPKIHPLPGFSPSEQ